MAFLTKTHHSLNEFFSKIYIQRNSLIRFYTYPKLLLITLFTLSAPSFAVELLSNGGFDSDTTGWSISGSVGTSGSGISGDSHTGSGAFYGYNNVAPGLSLSQSVTSGSDTKTLSFLLRTNDGSGVSHLDDLSVTLIGSTYRVSGYVKTFSPGVNTLSFTFGDKPRQALTLTSSYGLFSYDYIFGPHPPTPNPLSQLYLKVFAVVLMRQSCQVITPI